MNITTPLVAAEHASTLYRPQHMIRFITATSLFDGHDAAINIMRRLLQQAGVEVIHLGHNRSVDEIVTAAIQEDVQGDRDQLVPGRPPRVLQVHGRSAARARRRPHPVFGGGGGVIVAPEIRELEAYGVERIYSPEDGQRLGLEGMIDDMVERARVSIWRATLPTSLEGLEAPRPAGARAVDHRSGERGRCRASWRRRSARGRAGARCRSSASPAPAAPASRR